MNNKVILAKFRDDGRVGETKVCVRCKRMFTYLGYGHFYCPVCKKIDEADFAKVKEYIYENGTEEANWPEPLFPVLCTRGVNDKSEITGNIKNTRING